MFHPVKHILNAELNIYLFQLESTDWSREWRTEYSALKIEQNIGKLVKAQEKLKISWCIEIIMQSP